MAAEQQEVVEEEVAEGGVVFKYRATGLLKYEASPHSRYEVQKQSCPSRAQQLRNN